jgi:hypothetical protein
LSYYPLLQRELVLLCPVLGPPDTEYLSPSSSYWPVYKFFASQSLHNRIFFKKKSGDVNDEANFSLFILLHKRAKPILPPWARELKTLTSARVEPLAQ